MLVSVQTMATSVQTGSTNLVYIMTQDVKFDIDDRVDLYCKIVAEVPFVTAQWIRDKTQDVLENKNFTFETDSQQFSHPLHHVIDKVSLEDNGLYICKAWFWNSSSSFRLETAKYNLKVRGN